MNGAARTVRQQHEAEVYDARAGELASALSDTDLIVDSARPPYPNREHVDFLDFVFARIGPLTGKRVLEVGCGSGTLSTYVAMQGAEAVGVDVSERMLDLARRRAAVNGVGERVDFRAVAVEDLDEPAASFDAIIANQVLHHLDLPRAMPNMARLVGNRGVVLCAEPVLFVPEVVRLARYSAPVTRFFPSRADTPDERSIDVRDLAVIRAAFTSSTLRPFQVTTRLQNFVSLSDRVFTRLERVDRRLLRAVPGSWRLARYVVLELTGAPQSPQRQRKDS